MRKRSRQYDVLLTLLPVLTVMGMIFCFSAQDGEESGRVSAAITALLLRLFVPRFPSLDLAQQLRLTASVGFFVRKAAHFLEFALLGFTLMLHFRTLAGRGICQRPALFAMLVGAAYAASDELHQLFVFGRGPSLRDVGIDSLGVAFAVLAYLLLSALIGRRRSARRSRRR